MDTNVRLMPAQREELPEFCKRLQEAFAVAVVETFGPQEGSKPIPSDQDVWESFNAPGAEVYHILSEDRRVGGAVVTIRPDTRHNELALFFISPEYHSRGLDLAAWRAIEARYPETEVWETVTPYFERRNIHFYVNKCGFHIVEFFNDLNPDPHGEAPRRRDGTPLPGMEALFRFEKIMK